MVTDFDPKELGKRIQLARTNADLTQADLARLLETHQESVSRWERGTVTPSVAQVHRIAAAIRIEPGWLFTRSNLADLPERKPENRIIQLLQDYNDLGLAARQEIAQALRGILSDLFR